MLEAVDVNELSNQVLPYLINFLKALVFLIVGFWIAGKVAKLLRALALKSETIDDTLGYFIASMAKYSIMIFVVIAVLQLFGFETTSLIAVLGAATLAIGMALQGTLGNIASGVMLVIFRPYKLADFVEIAGVSGTIKDINLFTTDLDTPDNKRIIIPNAQAWGSIIINYSTHKVRRCDFLFGIDYNDDADKAMKIILDEVKKDKRVMKKPSEPWVRVTELGASSVDIQLRIWVKSSDLWEVKFALTKNIKEAFDKNGISIPYPHQVLINKTG